MIICKANPNVIANLLSSFFVVGKSSKIELIILTESNVNKRKKRNTNVINTIIDPAGILNFIKKYDKIPVINRIWNSKMPKPQMILSFCPDVI